MALRLRGSTSGYAEIDASAAAGDVTLTLPSTTGTINVKDASGNTSVGTGVNLGNPGANIFTIDTNGSERLRIAADGSVTIPGNLNISGVLTYEDVTSVDAIGLSTFREGLNTKDVGITTISSSISDTAIDVFIYDTSKDSDGGAWRKRTSHTSWYNETLGTATRGTRKEFPAVAVIVAEAAKVTIYDGDDPELPLWISFPTTNATGVTALNGELCLSSSRAAPSYHSLLRVNFIADQAINHRESNTATVQGYFLYSLSSIGLAAIDNGPSSWTGYLSEVPNIVSGVCNDVAMTVLPNAPIDDATGLPRPTIAVATNGGVSVIKDDGSIVDKETTSEGISMVAFTDIDKLIAKNSNVNYIGIFDDISYDQSTSYLGNITDATFSHDGVFESDPRYNYPNPTGRVNNNADAVNLKDKTFAFGVNEGSSASTSNGFNILQYTTGSDTDNSGILVGVTTSYNTGWMHGDIKGAFLSDTIVESFSPSNLVTEDFSSNWTGASNGVLSVLNNRLTITNSGGTNGRAQSNTFATTSGKKYAFIVRGIAQTGGATFRSEVRGPELVGASPTAGTLSIYFNGTGNSSTFVELYAIGANGASVTYEDAYVVEVEDDRSVNNKGLQVVGTITKSAVATGAELVAYSGFSVSDYIKQPFDDETMNHGTGDFCYVMWVNIDDSGSDSQTFVDRSSSTGGTSHPRIRIHKHTNGVVRFWTNGGATTGTTSIENKGWTHIVALRRSTNTKLYINGILEQSASSDTDFTSTAGQIQIGLDGDESDPLTAGSIALVRVSASAPSPEQIKKMYDDEKHLFHENAQATLYGSSDAVTALAYDEVTDQLHVGTSSGRSDFQGLRRINNTTTAVTTAISAHDTFIIEQ